jgi:hypothetical protein
MGFLLEARKPRGLNGTKWAVLGIYIIYIYIITMFMNIMDVKTILH